MKKGLTEEEKIERVYNLLDNAKVIYLNITKNHPEDNGKIFDYHEDEDRVSMLDDFDGDKQDKFLVHKQSIEDCLKSNNFDDAIEEMKYAKKFISKCNIDSNANTNQILNYIKQAHLLLRDIKKNYKD